MELTGKAEAILSHLILCKWKLRTGLALGFSESAQQCALRRRRRRRLPSCTWVDAASYCFPIITGDGDAWLPSVPAAAGEAPGG